MITENDKLFIGYAITECAKEGIQVTFLNKTILKTDNVSCDGWFNEGEKKLFVAAKNPMKNFFPVFVHEFCHFKQWITKEKSYMNVIEHPRLDGDMWDWLEGEEIPMDRVRKSVEAYREMELNCEKMVVDYIDEFNLSINKEFYIRTANVYVLSYGLLLETRKWLNFSPDDDRLLDLVPKRFVKSFKLPVGFKKRIKSIYD